MRNRATVDGSIVSRLLRKKVIKVLFLLSGLILSGNRITAQTDFRTFDTFNDSYIRFYIKRLAVKPSTDKAYGGFTANFSWDSKNWEQWDKRFMWEQGLFSDAIAGIVKKYVLQKPITQSGLDHSFSTGIFGSFQYGFNLVAKERLLISPCLSFGDYVIAAERFEDTNFIPGIENNGRLYRDPAGYFFVAGPSVVISYIPTGGLWIDTYVIYDLTAFNVGETNIRNFVHVADYPNPHFLSLGFNINHRSRFYTGMRFYSLIDRGFVNTGLKRLDINVGINLGS